MARARTWSPTVNRFEQAAVTILRKARRPLSVREITDKMIELGLAESSGKTPQNTMQNTIRRANKRRKANGETPLFVRKRDGVRLLYSLTE